jgi:hypothetical protein
MDSADASLAGNYFYADRHRQFCRSRVGRASGLDNILAFASALFALVQWAVHVCAALCQQAPNREVRDVRKDEVEIDFPSRSIIRSAGEFD